MNFFINNADGYAICVDGERGKICNCYREAEEFYINQDNF